MNTELNREYNLEFEKTHTEVLYKSNKYYFYIFKRDDDENSYDYTLTTLDLVVISTGVYDDVDHNSSFTKIINIILTDYLNQLNGDEFVDFITRNVQMSDDYSMMNRAWFPTHKTTSSERKLIAVSHMKNGDKYDIVLFFDDNTNEIHKGVKMLDATDKLERTFKHFKYSDAFREELKNRSDREDMSDKFLVGAHTCSNYGKQIPALNIDEFSSMVNESTSCYQDTDNIKKAMNCEFGKEINQLINEAKFKGWTAMDIYNSVTLMPIKAGNGGMIRKYILRDAVEDISDNHNIIVLISTQIEESVFSDLYREYNENDNVVFFTSEYSSDKILATINSLKIRLHEYFGASDTKRVVKILIDRLPNNDDELFKQLKIFAIKEQIKIVAGYQVARDNTRSDMNPGTSNLQLNENLAMLDMDFDVGKYVLKNLTEDDINTLKSCILKATDLKSRNVDSDKTEE